MKNIVIPKFMLIFRIVIPKLILIFGIRILRSKITTGKFRCSGTVFDMVDI